MKQYQDGPIPIQKRSCTDSICLFIFFLFTIVMLIIGIYSWTNGNFKQLTHGYDPDGKGCGVDYPNYPYIYFASPHVDSLWVTVCVSACPVQGDTSLKCQTNSVVTSCNPVISSNNTQNVQIYDSSIMASSICLPSSQTLQGNIASALGSSTQQITTLMQNYTLILLAFPIAILLSLIVLVLVRCLAGCFVYILVLLTVGALAGLGIYLLTQTSSTGTGLPSVSIIQDGTARTIVAILLIVSAILVIVVLCCFRNRLALASKIIEVSAAFVAGNCGVVFVPFLMFIITLLFVALWILEALGFYSLGTPSTTPHQYPFQHFTISNTIMILGGVHIFYLLWCIFFLVETSCFLVTGTAASWYYRRQSPYSETSERYRSKHMGSVCFGAFFKALIAFIKFMYDLLTPQKTSDESSWQSKLNKFCDCLCCLCMKLFDWLNTGAYTVVNIVGDSYCTSALKAASIRLNNLASTAILGVLSTVFTLIIRVGITALTVFAIYLIGTNVPTYKDAIQDITLILVITGLIGFAISSFFVSVYTDSMESIYTTYLLDAEAGGKVDLCPDELRDFLAEAQKQNHIVSQ